MKIGLIAMSGIRCCDNELLQLGLTLPGFVERSKVIAALPSLGLLTLAGMTPKEHEVEYVEIPDMKNLESVPMRWISLVFQAIVRKLMKPMSWRGSTKKQGCQWFLADPM